MLKKISLLMGFAVCTASGAFAQTIKENIEKKAKDPTTTENAAKADVYIQGHKITNDSNAVQKKQPAATSRKKHQKNCGRKGSQPK